jgi:hypothetical protein
MYKKSITLSPGNEDGKKALIKLREQKDQAFYFCYQFGAISFILKTRILQTIQRCVPVIVPVHRWP